MQSKRVFISHSSQDKKFAESVVTAFRSPDLAPWIDSEQIVTGDDIFDELGHGLQSMDILVFLASRASLKSELVRLEVKYAIKREIDEKRALVLPFIIDDTPTRALPWYLSHRNAPRVTQDAAGAGHIAASVRQAVQRRSSRKAARPTDAVVFKRDPRIERLIKDVNVSDWAAADRAALEIVKATDKFGHNDLFEALLEYQDYPNKEDDILWGALMTIESCVQLASWLINREKLARMANHQDFQVRSSMASICMDLAEFAPSQVPVDLVMKLAVYNEDWYVQAPATATLKSLAHLRPSVLRIFYERLASTDPDERAHAARAVADIADKEPEILDLSELKEHLSALKGMGDREARDYITRALPKVKQSEGASRFRYGL